MRSNRPVLTPPPRFYSGLVAWNPGMDMTDCTLAAKADFVNRWGRGKRRPWSQLAGILIKAVCSGCGFCHCPPVPPTPYP